jgi:UDP-glucose 4-epimerase
MNNKISHSKDTQPDNNSRDGRPLRWLITGGCGFIGTSLIRHLIAQGGHAIRVVDNLSVGTKDDLASACTFEDYDNTQASMYLSDNMPRESCVQLIVGDIKSEILALQASHGMDIIVHLAANTGVGPSVEDPRQDCVTNVIGTLNYLEGARHGNVKRFVFASSGAPIGECNPPIHEELPARPVSPYGASKLAGEGYCSAYFRSFGVETIALRFGNVYGPGSGHKNSVVAKFIRQAINGEILEIYGDGSQTRDFIYIEDLVDAIHKASTLHLQKDHNISNLTNSPSIGGEIFQIATNKETTIREMVEVLVHTLKYTGVDDVKLIHADSRQGDVMRNFSDTTKARKILGWNPTIDLSAGLLKTIQSFTNKTSV